MGGGVSRNAWDDLYGSTAWATLHETAIGPTRTVGEMLDDIRDSHDEQVEELEAEIKRLRAWIGEECPACGGIVAYDASRRATT